MKLKDIKTGETYNVRVKVLEVINGNRIITTTSDSACATIFFKEELPAFSPVTPAPKYDPCRKFRKGDKVRVVEWNGREIARIGMIGEVVANEYNSKVELSIDGWTKDVYYPSCHLELVTPVEELEPYYVEEEGHSWCVRKPEPSDLYSTLAWFSKKRHPQAKQAAEAECKRLNAEYRKEKE